MPGQDRGARWGLLPGAHALPRPRCLRLIAEIKFRLLSQTAAGTTCCEKVYPDAPSTIRHIQYAVHSVHNANAYPPNPPPIHLPIISTYACLSLRKRISPFHPHPNKEAGFLHHSRRSAQYIHWALQTEPKMRRVSRSVCESPRWRDWGSRALRRSLVCEAERAHLTWAFCLIMLSQSDMNNRFDLTPLRPRELHLDRDVSAPVTRSAGQETRKVGLVTFNGPQHWMKSPED